MGIFRKKEFEVQSAGTEVWSIKPECLSFNVSFEIA
jgi:hypothetical protein